MATEHTAVGVDHSTVVPEDRPRIGLAHLTVVPENYDPDDA